MSMLGEECAIELFDVDLRPEIEVGDEVRKGDTVGLITAVRTEEDGTLCISVLGSDGTQLSDAKMDDWELTGRHFSDVSQILQNIGRFG